MNNRKHIWMLLAMIVALAATCYVFRGILHDPAHIVHELGGDGMKNYYAFISHSLYGHGWWFNGMNYPYGEHIMFVDGQPILTVTLSWLRQWWQFTPENLNVVLNLLMTLAFFLGIVYVYKILVRLGVAPIWAMLFAPLIITVSMQNFRVFGLYGLSYACVIPMMFYWFLHYHDSGKKKYMLYLLAMACIVMFLHPYQLALILIWSALYIVGYWFFAPSSRKNRLRHIVPVALVLVCSFIVLKSVLAATDHVTDRPEYPHGLLSYGTTCIDIFTNAHSPYWTWMQKKRLVTGEIGGDAQSYAYTGVAAILVTSVVVITLLILLLLRRKEAAKKIFNVVPAVWWFIAAGALLFSMGVPFVWGMQWTFDYVSVLRQFRSLGWFALLFYYIITVIAVVVVTRAALTKSVAGKFLPFIIFVIWAYEAYGISTHLYERSASGNYNYQFFNSHQEKNWNEFFKAHSLRPSDFQAVLFVPYQHVGSEKIWLSDANWGLCMSMKAAFQLQLPLVDASMSRSSWQQTFDQVKIAAGPYAYKTLIQQVKDERPFLLLHFEGEQLNPDEKYLFQHADSIGVNSNLVAYKLHPRKLATLEKKEWERIRTSSHTDTPYYYEPFAGKLNKQTIFGNGSQMAIIGKDTVLASIDVRHWPKDILYEASAWFLVNRKDYRTPAMEIKCLDTTGAEINTSYLVCGQATDTRNMWFRPSKYFTLPEGSGQILLRLNNTPDIMWYRLDEIMIRAATDTIVMKDDEQRTMVNNHLLPQ